MSLRVRVRLDSFDVVHPTEKQTQVHVEIPDVARTWWLLPPEMFNDLRDEQWADVVKAAIAHYEQRWIVTDSASEAARKAVGEWLAVDENWDALNVAWFEERARRDPVSRSLLRDKERLQARIAELEKERHSTNESLSEAAEALRVQRDRIAEMHAQREALAVRLRAGQHWQRGRNPELVSEDLVSQSELREIFGLPLVAPWGDGITRQIAPVQALRKDESAEPASATIYRAEHPDSGITLGHYGTEAAARAHCEASAGRDPVLAAATFSWIEDDEDRVAELVAELVRDAEVTTGYIVTALEVPSEYDEEADE